MFAQGSGPVARYTIHRGLFRSSYDVTLNGQQAYHVDNSHYTPGKPDLTFHAGVNTSGPIAGVIKYRHFSSDTEIGLCDPSQPHAMQWLCLSRGSIMSVRYSIQVIVAGDRRPRIFTWKRTSSLSSHSGGLKLVDGSDRVVAVFSTGGTFSSTTGQIDIYVQYGERFQLLVLMSGLALREKLNRQRHAGAGAGAGAAGAAAGGGGA